MQQSAFRVVLAALLVAAAGAHAQSGISRVGGVPVQPVSAPTLAPAAPQQHRAQQSMMPAPIAAPGVPGAPLPGGPLPGPLNLKQEALDKSAPLTAEEILEFRREMLKRGQAAQQPLQPVGKPTRRFISLDFTPGATPEVIRAAYAQGSVVSFVDAAGRPWPVSLADNFNPDGFDTAVFGANGVSIGVKKESPRTGNIAVLLEGLTTPITFSVVTGQREVDYSVEVQVPRYLPGQAAPVGAVEQIRSLGAADLMNYLLNTPPKTARQLVSDSPNVTAWQVSPERMVVRTEALVASPAWQRRQSSTSGVSVYDLPLTPALVVAAQGQLMTVRVSGFAATKEQR